MSGLSP